MSKEKTYRVRVTGNFTAASRRRAGIEVDAAEGYEGPLTGDQIKAIEADDFLQVSEATDEPSQEDSQAKADQVVKDAEARAEEIVKAAQEEAAAIKAQAEEEAATTRKAAAEAAQAEAKRPAGQNNK